ncbi:MAG: 50S ribosomal protein L9 [Actinomycetota bacterium]|nr:50S ribosomal protein L9 [Chloroflexota bacterium]MDH4349416.1 50S ribosomal protein L9 [Gemmatimonadota bacterium]MDH5278513.1 50S ribosomal protein L9 [Actinomycetota bacterium]
MMEVILRQDIDDLGKAGSIVKVKDGYGRNFLLPRGLAYQATAGNKRRVEAEARQRGEMLSREKDDAEAFAARLAAADLTFQAQAGEGDKLFGSITSADIAAKLAELGHVVDKRIIDLPEPLKMVGVYKVPIRLHAEVRPEVRVWVVKA